MVLNTSFAAPQEYMLASTFSGRVVFSSESLISYIGSDLTGKNLNEIFPDEISAHILYNCRANGSYHCEGVRFIGSPVALDAETENDEIIIFIQFSPSQNVAPTLPSPVNKVSYELDSSISVMSMMLDNINASSPSSDPDAFALMNKQLIKLTRLSKNVAAYSQHLAKEHFVNYKKVSVNEFIGSLIDSVRQAVDCLPVTFTFSAPDKDVFAMIDAEKIRRALLNVITNSIASRNKSVNISITLYPVVSDIVSIVIRDNGRGFSPRVSSDEHDATTLVNAYNSFGFAVSHIFLELHGGNFSVISEQNKGSVVSISFPCNMDKEPPAFASMIPSYSGNISDILLELSPVLPPEKYIK